MNSSAMSVGEVHDGTVCVVMLSGPIDSTNANDLMNELNALVSAGETTIALDLGSVLYLTNAAFRDLLIAIDEIDRNAANFVLCSLGGHVRDRFEMVVCLRSSPVSRPALNPSQPFPKLTA
jgi:anti-anti-sigma factor